MGDVDSEVLAFLCGVNVVEGGFDTITEPENDFKGLMPVLDFIVALVPPWKQWILTVTISFSVRAEAGGLDPVDC